MSIGQTVVPYSAFQDAFQSNPDQLHAAVQTATAKAAGGDPAQQQQFLADWLKAIDILSKDAKPVLKKGDKGRAILHTPKDALASRLQTLLVKQATAVGQVEAVQPEQTIEPPSGEKSVSLGVLSVKFDNDDIFGWLQMAPELLFKPPKAPWIDPQPNPQTIPDNARIAVFADWGTGLYGAPAITKCVEGLDRCDVVLHLGDTYYSGEADEVRERLVANWPKRAGAINRALNGNHEMYSGGKGYFQALSDFFKQSASCFALQNSGWILVCLDTAYEDFNLDEKQVAWVKSIVNAAGSRKLILFSHHQPFSQLDDQGPNLQKALVDLLNTQRIHAWFWGHEHRLVLYDAHRTWGFKGRCIGHGGFPGFRDDLPDAHGNVYQWLILPEQPQAPKAQLLDGPNFWIPQDPEGFSPHGYVVLDFDGDTVWETYRVPNNIGVLKTQL